jgi:zinc D-Ala-D-Ala carboxypeptidase
MVKVWKYIVATGLVLTVQPVINNVFGDDTIMEKTVVDDKLRQYLSGKFEPKQDSLFVAIPAAYSGKADVQYLRTEALDGFVKMADEAKKDGVILKIVSATRNFYSQKAIWETKWNGKRADWKDVATKYPLAEDRARAILRYSSMPGTSRHHWGTDIDINSVEPEYFETKKGKKEYDWLVKNGARFGFCQPYSVKGVERPNGYEEEKWHWSYMPLSKEFISQYPNTVSYADIKGFDGDETAEPLKVIDNYVLGVSADCK